MRIAAHIGELIDDLVAQYALGGPPVGSPHDAQNWDAIEAHGSILALLDNPPGFDEPGMDAILRDCMVTTPAALSAVLRLVGTYAAMSALAWVLDEPIGSSVGREAPSRDDVLREARAALPDAWRLS
jgi:hypothetical protein